MPTRRRWAGLPVSVVAIVATATGCPDVPEIRFVDDPDAGGADAAEPTRAEAAADASASTPGADAATVDAARVCPGTVPPGAALCCFHVACYGKARDCADHCDDCLKDCGGRVCCARSGGGGGPSVRCGDEPSDCTD